MESRRTSSASLSSDDKDDTPELAAAAPTLSKLPLYKYQLAHPESILIRPLYNLSLKRRGGQHPHRTKMEVFNLKKYRCIKKWGGGGWDSKARERREVNRLPLFTTNSWSISSDKFLLA